MRNSHRLEFSSVCDQVPLSIHMSKVSKVSGNSRSPELQLGFSNRFEMSNRRDPK